MDKEEMKKREKNLIEAFQNESFRNSLYEVEKDLRDKMNDMLEEIKKDKGKEDIRMFLESRVKSLESFKEKINRKEYVENWDIGDNLINNEKVIRENLPDLIGFRINCLFYDDEEKIFEKLKSIKMHKNIIRINKDENNICKNGNKIFKITGIYRYNNEDYNFEIQIKSYIYNLWGEVDHRTIYKGEKFSVDSELKKNITNQALKTLKATDSQLHQLYKNEYDEVSLIRGLFYQYSHDDVEKNCNTSILAEHYTNFYELFFESDSNENIKSLKKYVAKKLLNEHFYREKPELREEINDEDQKNLEEKINKRYTSYCLSTLFQIASCLFKYNNEKEFIAHLANLQLRNIFEAIKDDYMDEFSEIDVFGNLNEQTDDEINNVIKILDRQLCNYIKEGK